MRDIFEYLIYTANLISKSYFGNKLILKGGSVLMSKLIEYNRTDLYRQTTDIDIHCNSKETWINFCNNIENILNNNDRGYKYKIVKRRSESKGLDTSDSLQFIIEAPNDRVSFKIDMNIKDDNIITIDYSPTLNMNTYDCYTMVTDKIIVVSSRKVFRRIKDLYDLAVLTSIQSYNYSDLMQHMTIKHPNTNLINMLTYDNFNDLEHAYTKFNGITNKPDINYLISHDAKFLEPLYKNYKEGKLIWNNNLVCWQKG